VGKIRHKQKIQELVVLKEEPNHVLKWEACPALLGREFLYSHHPPFHPSIHLSIHTVVPSKQPASSFPHSRQIFTHSFSSRQI
jgi:hypothetical protein